MTPAQQQAQKETEKSTSILQQFGKAIAAVGAVTVGPTAALTGFAAAMGSFVNKANPAVFDQFKLALNDTLAVIGRSLVPLFQQVFIPVLRRAGDILLALAPSFKALADALEPMVDVVGDLFAGGIKILVNVMQIAIPVIGAVTRIINDLFKSISDFFGLRDVGAKPGGAVGAATRSAAHTSVEEALKQAQRASFSLGTAAADPVKIGGEIKAMTDKIYEILTQLPLKIWEYVKQLPNLFLELWEKFRNGGIGRALLQPNSPEGRGARSVVGAIPGGQFIVAAERFGREVDRQFEKPGLFGFTKINPF